jgi:tetratricopeptide (TPR) repeat protein
MNIRLILCAYLLICLMPVAPAVAAVDRIDGNRFALVIGNANYPGSEAPLKEPINDARDIADELKHDGFNVEVGENLTGDAMRLALDRLYGKIKPGSVAMIFFSGVGLQTSRQSYLIPVDANIWFETDVRRDGFSLETVLNELSGRGAAIKIALLDASRRNPFERRFRNAFAGLAPVIAPSGTLVMYATALDAVIPDVNGDRGLFAAEWLKEIRAPDLITEATLNRIRTAVSRASRGEQMPWLSFTLVEKFSFSLIPWLQALPAQPQPPRAEPVSPAVTETRPTSPPEFNTPAVAIETPKPLPSIAGPPKPAPSEAEPRPSVVASTPPVDSNALASDPAIMALNGKIAANPNDQSSWYRRGQLYAVKGAYQLAVKDFDEAIRLNPRDVEAYNNRCWTQTVIGDFRAASKDCDEALRLRPGFVDALDSRGLLNLKSGKARNAIADFDAALAINPRLTSSLYGRGLAKLRNGAAADGERDIISAKAINPNIANEFATYGLR